MDDFDMSMHDAATELGVNLRQVQKRIAKGYIRKQYLPKLPSESAARVVVSRSDVAALKDGTHPLLSEPTNLMKAMGGKRFDPVLAPKRPAASNALALAGFPAPTGDGTADLERIRQLIGLYPLPSSDFEWLRRFIGLDPLPSYGSRAWLTLAEAVEYSGLTEALLVRRIHMATGGIIVEGRGPTTWRIQRASLDAIGGKP